MRFHDLRHTAASLILLHNVPVLTVSRRLGHAKPSTTLDVYGHLIPGMQEVAARVMDEVVTLVTLVMLDLSLRYPQESQIAELPQNGGDRQHDS